MPRGKSHHRSIAAKRRIAERKLEMTPQFARPDSFARMLSTVLSYNICNRFIVFLLVDNYKLLFLSFSEIETCNNLCLKNA